MEFYNVFSQQFTNNTLTNQQYYGNQTTDVTSSDYVYVSPQAYLWPNLNPSVKEEETLVKDDFVVVNSEGHIVFQSDEEKKALKWMRKNADPDTAFFLYKVVKRIGPKMDLVEEDL